MNLELSPADTTFAEVVRAALARKGTVAAARAALDGATPLDLWAWTTAMAWCGTLLDKHEDGAGDLPGLLPAVLLHIECGRALAGTGLLGHSGAVAALAGHHDPLLDDLLTGRTRGVLVAAIPSDEAWTVRTGDPLAATTELPCYHDGELTGRTAVVPDLGVDAALVVPVRVNQAVVVAGDAPGVTIHNGQSYDPTRPAGSAEFDRAPARLLPVRATDLRRAWDTTQLLLAAEALGVCEAVLGMATEYARQRHAFSRPIGSFQAVKHQLADVLRRTEDLRSLVYFAVVAHGTADFSLACASARLTADNAVDTATRTCLAVHGAVGVTWEHDMHLYFRRAQLSRLLHGGATVAAEHVLAGTKG